MNEHHHHRDEADADKAQTLASSLSKLSASSRGVPSGKDFHFFNNFDDFKNPIREISNRSTSMLHAINDNAQVWRQQEGPPKAAAAFPEADMDDAYDWLVNVNDELLERFDVSADEFGKKEETDSSGFHLVHYGNKKKGPSASASAGASAVKVATKTKPKVPFHIPSIRKPQEEFNILVNNSNQPFQHVWLQQQQRSDDDQTTTFIHPLEKLSFMDFVDKDIGNVDPVNPPSIESTPFKLVEEVKDLKELAAKLRGVNEFAVDLEHNQYRSFQGLTCLMQISTRTEDFVVDTLKLRIHIGPYLREVFKDPTKRKVMHGADRDIVWLQRDFGIYICNLFDTGQASKVLKLERNSLEFLLHHFCGVSANKEYQNADWRLRPLPEEMLRYAREDTHYLLYIYDLMRIKLYAMPKEAENIDAPLVEVMQADNGSFAYFMPGFQPSYAPYLPVTTIGVDGQYVDQQAYLSSPMFQPPVASPGYYAPTFPYGELLPSPYMWDPSLRVGDGAFGNSYAGFPEFSDPKSNLSSPSHTRAPLPKGYSEFSSPLGINSSLPSLDISSGHGMRKQLKPVNKFSAQNQGKGASLYSNNLVNLKANVTGWGSTEKMKSRSKINGVTTISSLNEQNQGPRTANAKGALLSGGNAAGSLATDGNGNSNSITSLIRMDQYNLPDFPTKYDHAFFFVIKSYSEDDIHKSIKYNVWASTPNGNKRLDGVYQDAQEKMAEKGSKCPVFLFFSVNASGQFCGVAEMIGQVDFNKSMDFWQQDKWNGYFAVKWHIIKDVPNPHLRHIILENNENKPVTNSRDTQEVRFPQGLEMLNIFKNHVSKTSILDDFEFYESREKVMQEKRTRQSIPLFNLQKIDELNTSFKSIDLSAVKSIEQPEVGDKEKK